MPDPTAANTEKVLALIDGDYSSYVKALKATEAETQKSGGLLQRIWDGVFIGIGMSITQHLLGLLTSIPDKIVGIFKSGVESAIEFESALTRLSTQGSYDIEAVRQSIYDLSIETGETLVGMVGAANEALMAWGEQGFDQVIRAADTLGDIFGGKLDITTRQLTDVMKAWNIQADQANKTAATMYAASVEGRVNLSALADVLKNNAQIAQANNISFNELAAAFASITKQGKDAELAGMALKMMMVNHLKPATDQATDAMQNFEMTGRTAEAQMALWQAWSTGAFDELLAKLDDSETRFAEAGESIDSTWGELWNKLKATWDVFVLEVLGPFEKLGADLLAALLEWIEGPEGAAIWVAMENFAEGIVTEISDTIRQVATGEMSVGEALAHLISQAMDWVSDQISNESPLRTAIVDVGLAIGEGLMEGIIEFFGLNSITEIVKRYTLPGLAYGYATRNVPTPPVEATDPALLRWRRQMNFHGMNEESAIIINGYTRSAPELAHKIAEQDRLGRNAASARGVFPKFAFGAGQ